MALCREQALKLTISVFGTLTGPNVDLTYCLYGRRLACLCFSPVEYRPQWRSQDLEVGGTGGLGDGSPPAGPSGRAPGGRLGRSPHESSQHITDIWLLNHAQFCVFIKSTRVASKNLGCSACLFAELSSN